MKHEINLSTKTDKKKPTSIHHEPLRDSKEVAIMFGYKDEKGLNSSIDRGSFPPPDTVIAKLNGTKKRFWKLSVVLKEKAKRDKLKINIKD